VPVSSGRAEHTPSFQTITEAGSQMTRRDPSSRFAREASASSKALLSMQSGAFPVVGLCAPFARKQALMRGGTAPCAKEALSEPGAVW
jgi:hypothetical protein